LSSADVEEAALRLRDQQGDPDAAYELGNLLASRGQLAEAAEAYGRADERGHGIAAANFGLLLQKRGDFAGAADAYRRAKERGEGLGALRLGLLLAAQGDWKRAESEFARAEAAGSSPPKFDLAAVLGGTGLVAPPTRSARQSAFANPVLVGAVTVLVAIVAVFLAYNANKGLPFVPTRELKVDIGDGSNLVPGNDVLEGGHRIGFVSAMNPVGLRNGTTGAQLALKLSKNEKVPVDSTVTVRLRSVLGSKYVDLVKGSSSHTFADGATMPISQTNVPVQLDQVFDVFNPPTRQAVQGNLVGFGNTFAARGSDLSSTIQSLPALLGYLTPVAAYLSDPSTGLVRFLNSLNSFTSAVSPVSGTLVDLFRDSATTFGAIAANPGNLEATIAKSPSTLAVSTSSLAAQQKFLTDLTTFGGYLTPATRSLKGALPNINPALEAGAVTLRQTPVLNQKLQQVMDQLRSLALDPGTNVALNGLIDTVGLLNPMVRYLGPYQTVCNYWNYTWTDLADVVSEPSQFGTAQRGMFMSANPLQPNNPGAQPASAPVNGQAPLGDLNPLGGNVYFRAPTYGAAVDNSGNADCETGQRGNPRQLNFFDPQHRLFDTDQHTPGNQGPTYAGRPTVPPGETFSRNPQIGPQTPFNPTNP
jgi:virulence factor Mce-like protein